MKRWLAYILGYELLYMLFKCAGYFYEPTWVLVIYRIYLIIDAFVWCQWCMKNIGPSRN